MDGVSFWLCCGSLLGYYRGGRFIEWDRDIDVAVRIEDYSPSIKTEMERAGFEPWRVFGSPEQGLELSYTRGGVKFDIFFVYEEADHVWHPIWDHELMYRYRYPKPLLSKGVFEGVEVQVPQKEYMAVQYGALYQEPDPEWLWNRSPRNLDDSDYWRRFYETPHTMEPSDFARSLDLRGSEILELGCGNGRDSYHLARHNRVLGIDQATKPHDAGRASFVQADIRDYIRENDCTADVVYMRFFLHSIPEVLEDEVLDWVKGAGLLFVEARTPTDALTPPSHFRRYIEPECLKDKLKVRGFRLRHFEVGRGLAVYGTEDPEVVRVVAEIS